MIYCNKLSKSYGNILGISDIDLNIKGDVFGLLGPNGAGKSTLLKILGGQLKAQSGEAKILNQNIFNNFKLQHFTGYCPEYDSFNKELTSIEWLTFVAKCYHIKDAKNRAYIQLEQFGLHEFATRKIKTFSLGMRQRLKLAFCMINDPEVIILDEPLRGLDPLWREKIINTVNILGEQGKTILVASHILPEIELMTNNIILINQGKIFADGNIEEIRNLLDKHPFKIKLKSSNNRKLSSLLIEDDCIKGLEINDLEDYVTISTVNRDIFYDRLSDLVINSSIVLEEMSSTDDKLQNIFDYIIGE